MRSRKLLVGAVVTLALGVGLACEGEPDETGQHAESVVCGEQTCGENEFCDFEYDWCEPVSGLYASGNAECASPGPCPTGIPVCGCDGSVYPDACAAYANGVDIGGNHAGGERCSHSLTPPGRFACGPWYCDATASYCVYTEGDVGDRWVECRPLPASCGGVATCECVPPSKTGFGGCKTVEGQGVTGVLVQEVLI